MGEAVAPSSRKRQPVVVVSFAWLNKTFKYFHLSNKLLSQKTFKFTPRIPREPFEGPSGIIEDDFTNRISLAPTIEKAIAAVEYLRPHLYVGDARAYAGDDIPVINLSQTACTQKLGMKYDDNFDMQEWLAKVDRGLQKQLKGLPPTGVKAKNIQKMIGSLKKQTGSYEDEWYGIDSPKELPAWLRDKFYACVPDSNRTREVWSVRPIRLIYAGRTDAYEYDQDLVVLSNAMVQYLARIGVSLPRNSELYEETTKGKSLPKDQRPMASSRQPTGGSGIEVPWGWANKTFKYFHLSETMLGSNEQFLFTPRLPRYPFGNIEDNFTKRVSLAPSIERALAALDYENRSFLYAGDIRQVSGDEIETLPLSNKVCSDRLGARYGENFHMFKWLIRLNNPLTDEIKKVKPGSKEEDDIASKLRDLKNVLDNRKYNYGPVNLPGWLKDKFYACVPDANKTKEQWALGPTNLFYVGLMHYGHKTIILSNGIVEHLKSLGVKIPQTSASDVIKWGSY